MKTVILIFGACLLVYVLYVAYDVQRKISIGRTAVQQSQPFTISSDDTSRSLLVVGDSTGVGVGADTNEGSVASLFAEHIGATYVENYSVSGATTSDLADQIQKAALSNYDYVLVQIGANDIIDLKYKERDTAASIRDALLTLSKMSDSVIHLSAGNVGAATIFPSFIRPIYHQRTLRYHKMFETIASDVGTTYVNLYTPPADDPFVKNPEVYLSKDELHPTSKGYALWFTTLIDQL